MIDNMKYQDQKGYTLLFSMLLTSLILAVAVSILGISRKELMLSTSSKDSQAALFAADSGLDCAMYLDFKNTFPPSDVLLSLGPVKNFTIDVKNETVATQVKTNSRVLSRIVPIAYASTPTPTPLNSTVVTMAPISAPVAYCNNKTMYTRVEPSTNLSPGDPVTYTFSYGLSTGSNNPADPCVIVKVTKKYTADGTLQTVIESYGHNNCIVEGARRVERAIRVTY